MPSSPHPGTPIWEALRRSVRSLLSRNVTGAILLLAAMTLAIGTGLLGWGRQDGILAACMDGVYFFASGRCWMVGLNPYDPRTLAANGGAWLNPDFFFYPPQVGFLSVFLASFSLPVAKVVLGLVNLGCAGLLAWLCVRVWSEEAGQLSEGPSPQARWLIPAIVLGCPFTANVLWMGQSSLIAAAALYSGWIVARRGSWIAGGALIGLSTLKPQLAFLPIVWLLLERRGKELAVGAAAAISAAAPAIRVSGAVGAYRDWMGTLSRVSSCPDSAPGADHLFSLHNVFASLGVLLPSFLPLAVVATAVLWWYRARVLEADVFPLLMGMTMLFGFASDYDLVALAPFVPAYWRHLRNRDGSALGAGLLMLLLFIPQRVFVPSGIPLLIHFRVFIVLFLTAWLLILSLRESRKRRAGQALPEPVRPAPAV